MAEERLDTTDPEANTPPPFNKEAVKESDDEAHSNPYHDLQNPETPQDKEELEPVYQPPSENVPPSLFERTIFQLLENPVTEVKGIGGFNPKQLRIEDHLAMKEGNEIFFVDRETNRVVAKMETSQVEQTPDQSQKVELRDTIASFEHALATGILGSYYVVGQRKDSQGFLEIETLDPRNGQKVWLSSNPEVSKTGENRMVAPPAPPPPSLPPELRGVSPDNPLYVEVTRFSPEAQTQLARAVAMAQTPEQLIKAVEDLARDQLDIENLGREALNELMRRRQEQYTQGGRLRASDSAYWRFNMLTRMLGWIREGEDVVEANVDAILAAAESYPDKPIQAQLLQEILGVLPQALSNHESLRDRIGNKIEARYKIHELNLLTKYADGAQIEDKTNSLYPHELESLKQTPGVWPALDSLEESAGDYYREKGDKLYKRQLDLIKKQTIRDRENGQIQPGSGFSEDLNDLKRLFIARRDDGLLPSTAEFRTLIAEFKEKKLLPDEFEPDHNADEVEELVRTALALMHRARSKDRRGVGPQTVANMLLPVSYLKTGRIDRDEDTNELVIKESKIYTDESGDPVVFDETRIRNLGQELQEDQQLLLILRANFGERADLAEIQQRLMNILKTKELNEDFKTLLTKTRIAFDIAEKIQVFTDEAVEAAGPELDHKKIPKEKLLELVGDFERRTGIRLKTPGNDPKDWDLPFIQLMMKHVYLDVPDYLTGRELTYKIKVMENGQEVEKEETVTLPKGYRLDLLKFYYGRNGTPPSEQDRQVMRALVAIEGIKQRNANLFANAWTAAKRETFIKPGNWEMIDPFKGLSNAAGRETSVEHWHDVRQMREATRWAAKMGLAKYSDTASVSLRQATGNLGSLKELVDEENWDDIYNRAVRPWGKRKKVNRQAHDALSEKEPYLMNSWESVFGKPTEALHNFKFKILGPDLQEATEIERLMETYVDGIIFAQKHMFDKTGGNFHSPSAIDMSYFIGHLLGKGIIEAETARRLIDKHLGGSFVNFWATLAESIGWAEGLMEAFKKILEGIAK